MRFLAPAWIALALTTGCLRFGYSADPSLLDAGFDSGKVRADGSVSDSGPAADGGGGVLDGGGMDAAVSGGAGGMDANLVGGNGAIDASEPMDAGLLDSAVVQARDSGEADSGISDSGIDGQTDAGIDAGTDAGVDAGGEAPDPGTTDPVEAKWTEDCPNMPGILFCDDFEDSLSKWGYTVHTRGSTAVTTDYKRGGSYSMHASTSAATSTVQPHARRGVKAFGHRKSGSLWARYYYYLPSSVTLTDKFSAGVISEYEDPWLGFSVLIFADGVGLESRGTSRKINTTTFPRNEWVCIEMHVVVASQGLYEYYFNGNQVMSLTGNTVPAMGYTSFEVGVHYANFGQGAIDVYTDDVKLGTARIGCN